VSTSAGVAACSDGVSPDIPEGRLELVVEGLDSPVHLTAPAGDDERLFVVEQPGRIVVVRDGAVLPAPFLDIEPLTSSGGERGLLGLAFHPEYATNGWFYVNHTDTDGDTRIVRYTASADPDVADPGTAEPILSVDQPFANHNGGQLAFGPDGMLYIGMGDGGDGGDPQNHAQRPETLLGSILRIDVDAGSPYAVPADNPFVDDPVAAPETWAYGLRNPWRFSFDRQTGDLYIADVGQRSVEEVSFQPASSGGGENYGWRIMEGTECYQPSTGCDTAGLVQPVHEYGHSDGCSITGGHVYRGTLGPTLVGRYFFADYCGTWIRSLRMSGGVAVDVLDHSADFGEVAEITSFGEDGIGELYVVSHRGRIYRFVAP
jgi:glucose/arabinose dehydrogenase